MTIRVLVGEDAASARMLLRTVLSQCSYIHVVGTAVEAADVLKRVRELEPDVVLLNREMASVGGADLLRHIVRMPATPAVVVTMDAEPSPAEQRDFARLGAVSTVLTPGDDALVSTEYRHRLWRTVLAASRAQPSPRTTPLPGSAGSPALVRPSGSVELIGIAASTGGTEAIRDVLSRMIPGLPPVVITQHLPRDFGPGFAARLNRNTELTVVPATDGGLLRPGHAYVAVAGHHLLVERQGPELVCRFGDGPPVGLHRPAADVMFKSIAAVVGDQAIGVLLTGMGRDGAKGMKMLFDQGAPTIAQDEPTSAIWGMPGAAVELGAAREVLPLSAIGAALIRLTTGRTRTRAS